MQGVSTMENKHEPDQEVLAGRKTRRLALAAEMKALGKYKKRLKHRLVDGRDWPLTSSGERAELDHEDVMAPLPDDMKAPIGDVDEKMQALRKEADKHQAFADEIIPIDEGVLSRRRREADEERTAREQVRGSKWTAELVENRMIEAYRTLFRASISGVLPKAFGNAMPVPIRQMSDLVNQANNKSLRNAISHRFKGTPSTDEVRRAEDSLAWAMTYLHEDHPDLPGFLQLGSMWKAWGSKIGKKCAAIGISRAAFYRDRKEAIEKIVEGLIRDGKAPT